MYTIEKLATIYERSKCQLPLLTTQQISEFNTEVILAYRKVVKTGVKFSFVSEEVNDFDYFTSYYEKTGIMLISSLHNNSKLLTPENNLKFRAVHDYIHYMFSLPFTFEGEVDACKIQASWHTSVLSKKILYSEIVLQAAYATHYGHFAPIQKVIFNY